MIFKLEKVIKSTSAPSRISTDWMLPTMVKLLSLNANDFLSIVHEISIGLLILGYHGEKSIISTSLSNSIEWGFHSSYA